MSTDEKTILKKYEQLKRLSSRVFGKQAGEDVAQEAIISFLEGRGIRQSNRFAIIDAARKRRSGTYRYRDGVNEPSQPNVWMPDTNFVYDDGLGPINESTDRYREDLFTFIRLVSHLKKPKLIQMVLLHESYEWTLLEISRFSGVTESRISQQITLSKKLLKKIAIHEGILTSEQGGGEQESSGILPPENKSIAHCFEEPFEELAEIQRTENERKSQLATRAFFKIPKTLFGITRENETKDPKQKPRMAKIKLERESFICPKMEKTTINFWPQKSR